MPIKVNSLLLICLEIRNQTVYKVSGFNNRMYSMEGDVLTQCWYSVHLAVNFKSRALREEILDN